VALVYVVTDIETDGPDPGRHSMVSLGAVACDAAGTRLGHLSLNLHPVEGHAADAGTMAWWATEPAAWAATLPGRLPPEEAMARYIAWVRGLGGTPVFAAYPLIFDGAWVDWYLRRYANIRLLQAPRSEARLFLGGGLDLASFALGCAGLDYAALTAKAFPRDWLGGHPHSHVALDDAEGYAHLLGRLLRGGAD
jgi:hypothetical protein